MAEPEFTLMQRLALGKCGLCRAQIDALEKTLPLAKALTGDVPRMQDVRDVLSDSRQGIQAAMVATKRLLTPKTPAQREASSRVMMADESDNPSQDGEAINNAFHALTKARDVLAQALAALPKTQRRKQTSVYMFRRIDKALLEGFIKDAGIGIKGLPTKPYNRIEPCRSGDYARIIRIAFDAMGLATENPDRAIRNYIEWLKAKKNNAG